MKPILIFIFLISASSIWAYPDSLKAVKSIGLAINKINTPEKDSVAVYAHRGFEIFKKNDDLTSWLSSHIILSNAWKDHEHYQKALDCFNEGLNNIIRNPRNESEYIKLAWTYANIGSLYYRNLNALDPAKDYYEIAKSVFTDTLGVEDYNVANYIYVTLGNIYSGLRDIENAKYYHEKANSIFKNLKKWDKVGRTYYNLALMYISVQDYSQASTALQNGLVLIDRIPLNKTLQLLTMSGKNYSDIKEYKQARHYTDWANRLVKENIGKISDEDLHAHQYEINYNYGLISKNEKKFKEAKSFYNKALEINVKEIKDRRQFAVVNQRLADLYFSWGKLEKAEEFYLESMNYILPVLSTVNDPDLIMGKVLTADPLLGFALEGIANTCLNKYEKTNRQIELEKAIQYYDLSNEVGLLLLQNYTTEGSKLTALNKQRSLKEVSLNTAYELYRIDSVANKWKEKMFVISESSKSFLQLENLQLSQAMDKWEESQILKYNKLKTNLATLESSIYHSKSKGLKIGNPVLDSLTKTYLETNEAITNIQNEQLKKDRKFDEKNYSSTFSVKSIKEGLAAGQVLIEYFMGEEQLYTFCISKSDFTIYRKKLPPDFFQLVEEFRASLLDLSTTNSDQNRLLYIQKGKFLYDVLLSEALSKVSVPPKRLIIVRDNILNFIPFDALITKEVDKEKTYFELPYLLKEYNIGYAASASLFQLQQQWEHGRATHLFAGFAPKYIPQKIIHKDTLQEQLIASLVRDGEFELKGASEEVNAVYGILGGKKYLNEQASEQLFKDNADDYQILLLAMHSLVNINDPNFSKLLFTKGASGDQEDDYLYALELYNMKLKADLAVLSACNTGYGKLQPGEGVMSLSRSFFSAGVPSTVMSLWKVPDLQTKEIMVSFFSYLKEGLAKDEALRLAKLNFLNNINDPKLAHPYFWAGFIPAGNTNPIQINTSNSKYWWWALLGVILLFSSLFFLQYNKRSS